MEDVFKQRTNSAYIAWLRNKPEVVAVDTETTGFTWKDKPFCATVAWRNSHEIVSQYIELDTIRGASLLRQILGSASLWIGHVLKFDLHMLLKEQIICREQLDRVTIEDTNVLAHLLDENRDNRLKPLAVALLGYDDTIMVPYKSGSKKGQLRPIAREKHELDEARRKLGLKKEDGYDKLPREVIIPYALKDAKWTLQLYELLRPQVAEITEVEQVYRDEMENLLVFLDAEQQGLGLDLAYLKDTFYRQQNKVNTAEYVCRDHSNDLELNIGSPTQVKAALWANGYDVASTDKEHLEEVAHPLAEAVLLYRKEKKLLDYLTAMLDEQENGVLHTNYKLNVRTGRTASGVHGGD